MNISKRLRDLREDADMTQKELAAKLQVPQTRISEWEKGVYEPRLEILCKYAEVFGVTLDYLACREPQKVQKRSPSK